MAKKNRHRRKCGMQIRTTSHRSYDLYHSSPVDYDNDTITEGDDACFSHGGNWADDIRPYSSNLDDEDWTELKAWSKLVGSDNVEKTLRGK